MKTRDKIIHCGLPPALARALAEALAPHAALDTAESTAESADENTADLLIHAAGSPLPERLSPATPRLGIETGRTQRLGTILRRCRQMMDSPAFYIDDMQIGDALFQPQEKIISAGESTASLTDKEVDILVYLARHAGKTLRREDLLHRVWRYQSGVDTHTLETHVYRLRQKLAALGGFENLLATDDDGGYKIAAPVTPAPATDAAAADIASN
ncbi:MAG TPA: winged helix-turn-helix domain-containing protein [Alphaproteobacteria bacterium]|nr:winged helix-turn-helix domain-containing protein [Alphaproteobacteria bacterium]